MSYEPPTPDNNLVLRNIQGLRREMLEMVERQACIIETVDRLSDRFDEMSTRTGHLPTRVEKGFADVRSAIVLMENKVLSAQSDIMRVVRNLDHDGAEGRS